MRQNASVQHVRVGQHDAGILADGGAVFLRGIAVIDGRCQVPGSRCEVRGFRCQVIIEGLQVGELILGEGFGGEEVEGAGILILKEGGKDGQVVGQGLSAGSAGGKDDVLACLRMNPGFELV